MAEYNRKHEEAVVHYLDNNTHVKTGQMFGHPAYSVNGKMAICVSSQGIVVKVGRDRAGALIGTDGLSLFEPMPGRAWKDWVLLPENIHGHTQLLDEAVQYVLKETGDS